MPTPQEAQNSSEQEGKLRWPRGVGIANGLCFGAALGVTFDNIAAGAAVGLLIGAAVDASQSRRK